VAEPRPGLDAGTLREMLQAGGELRLSVSGGSMRPALREGDCLVVRPLAGPPHLGEVLVYARGGRLWAHRLLARSPSGRFMLTKGDARGRPDALLGPEDLVGRAVAVERAGRRTDLASLGSRLAGLAVSLSAPAAALGRRLVASTGLAPRARPARLAAAGFVLELSAPPQLLDRLPAAPARRPGPADLRVELGLRREPTTGGRYGLSPSGRGQHTFTSPAVVARLDLAARTCRGEVVATREEEGLAALLRVLCILLVTEPGEGLALHASAALRGGRVYLFSGPGGAGKSTALRRALEAGAEPLADDLVLLRREAGRWLAWGLPAEPGLGGGAPAAADGAPVAALLLPERGGPKLELERLSPARWATRSAVFPPGAPLHGEILDRLGDLAESAPAWRVAYADRRGAFAKLFERLDREA
jgi:hypothetical protein